MTVRHGSIIGRPRCSIDRAYGWQANAVAVAEHIMFFMLAAAKSALLLDSAVRNDGFDEPRNLVGIE